MSGVTTLGQVVDRILGLHGWAVLAVIFRAPLLAVLVAAVAGAIIGDSVGYLVGRRWSRGLLDGSVGRLVSGHHLDRAERYLAQRASLLLLLALITTARLVLAIRWLIARPDRITPVVDRQLQRPWVARLRDRYQHQLAFLARRLQPGGALGLSLTVTVAALVAAGWAFGAVLQDVLARDELALVDQPVALFFVGHREAWLTRLLQDLINLGSVRILLPLILLVGVGWWLRRRTWRPRPPLGILLKPVTGPSFPSGHATQAVAVYGMLAALLTAATPSWARKVTAWAAAVVIVGVVAVSRLYLGAHWLTDVLGGLALGAAWLFALLTSVRTINQLRAHRADQPPQAATEAYGPPAPPTHPTQPRPSRTRGGRHG